MLTASGVVVDDVKRKVGLELTDEGVRNHQHCIIHHVLPADKHKLLYLNG